MNSIKINTEEVKNIYVDESLVHQIYMNTTLLFARLCEIKLILDPHVDYVQINYIDPWDDAHSKTISQTATLQIPYGSSCTITAAADSGYTMNTYQSSIPVVNTDDISLTFSTTINYYTVDINLCDTSLTQYGHTIGDHFGTFQYSTDGINWSGTVSDYYASLPHGTTIHIRNISSAPGWFPQSVNGTSWTSGSTYQYTVNANDLTVTIIYKSSLTNTRFSSNFISTFTENSINKTGFSVSARMSGGIGACDAGAVIAHIPNSVYRPTSDIVIYEVPWRYAYTTSASNTTILERTTITIKSNGDVTTSVASLGSGSAGGKNTPTTYWYYSPTFSASWNTKSS